MSLFATTKPCFPAATLASAGLNRYAILALDSLPADIVDSLQGITGDLSNFRQLILIGHGGRALWEGVQAANIRSADPIDDYTVKTIAHCFAAELPETAYQLIYPSQHPIGLQRLGELAGWHHASPFMVGIDSEWGSWSAYRAVLLTNSDFPLSGKVDRKHPCPTCIEKMCISHCPAQALNSGQLELQRCLNFRLQPDSPCQHSCLARVACPVGKQHAYSEAQMCHVYGTSLQWIRQQSYPLAPRVVS